MQSLGVLSLLLASVFGLHRETELTPNYNLTLTYDLAIQLAEHPMRCIKQEYPFYMSGYIYSAGDVVPPSAKNPIFYGCQGLLDSIISHWMLAALAKRFPGTELEQQVADIFDEQFTSEKTAKEVPNDMLQDVDGWQWVLKLHDELRSNHLDAKHGWSARYRQVADKVASDYKYINMLVIAFRQAGFNHAYHLTFPLEHADSTNNTELANLIRLVSVKLFGKDKNCPLERESTGDFLSPCLMEANLMAKVMNQTDYSKWLRKVLPQLFDEDFQLKPGSVGGADDLNFSRAYNLYSVATRLNDKNDDVRRRLIAMGDEHVLTSLENARKSRSSGNQWMILALETREEAVKSIFKDY